MPALNYTTSVAASKTITEIQVMLAKAGADRIAIDYTDRKPSGLSFSLQTTIGQRVFMLPVDVKAVQALLTKQRANSAARIDARPEQAERVAWRVMKDWLAAQLALIEAQMATMDQIMLPYLRTDRGITVYEAFRDHALELTQ